MTEEIRCTDCEMVLAGEENGKLSPKHHEVCPNCDGTEFVSVE